MKINEVAKVNDKSLSSNINFSEYRYLDTSNLTKNIIGQIQTYKTKSELPSRAKRLVKQGDILLSTVRPIQCHYGFMENPEENLIVSTGFTVITPNSEYVDGRYLYYFLTQDKMTKYFQMIAESAVSSYPSITSDVISDIKIDFPSISEQKIVSNKLKAFDDKLFNNLFLIEALEEYSQLLFHKWFVDFNFPDENGNPYKDSGGEMVEVDGKMVPKGWNLTSIGKVSNNFDSKRVPLSDGERSLRQGTYPYYGATKVMDYIDEYIFDGDFCLIAEDGSVIGDKNKPIMQYATGKFWVNNHTHVLQGKNVSTEYLYLSLSRTNVMGAVTGAIQKKINQQNLNRLPIMLPSKVVLEKFDTIILPIFNKVTLLKTENQLLEETRDLLIKKLIK